TARPTATTAAAPPATGSAFSAAAFSPSFAASKYALDDREYNHKEYHAKYAYHKKRYAADTNIKAVTAFFGGVFSLRSGNDGFDTIVNTGEKIALLEFGFNLV